MGKCNERYFINGIGIGFEGAVVKTLHGKKKRPGKASFFISILKNVLTYRSKTYRIQSAEQNCTGKKLLVDISNGRRAGGGFHIAPTARADDGLLDIVIADALSPLQRLRYLPSIEKGKHLQLPFIQHYLSRQISIECAEPVPFHLDGEYAVAKKFDIEILPGFIHFRY
jgi:diacylglycerol kinase family enzyme